METTIKTTRNSFSKGEDESLILEQTTEISGMTSKVLILDFES
jgi:hypothetical protein